MVAVGGAAAPREEVAAVRAAASLVVVAALLAVAAVAGLLLCRGLRHAPLQLTGRVVAEATLQVDQATEICLDPAPVSAIVRAVAILQIVQVPVDREPVRVPALEQGRESAGAQVLETLQVADDRRAAICRIS